MKHFLRSAVAYALIGLAAGVFYRELTKLTGFEGTTRLSFLHGHYLSLGLFFFLFLLVLEKLFDWSARARRSGKLLVLIYHLGLNITGLGFVLRGLSEVACTELSPAASASISGISGLGHIALAVSMVMILLSIGKSLEPA